MDPEIYLLKLSIVELETENKKLKQLAKRLLKPKVPPPPTQELVDQSDLEKFRYGLLVQGSDSVEEYYSKIMRCNEIVKYSEDYL